MKYHELESSTKVILKVIFAGLALAFLWQIRDILLLLLLSLIFASAMDPMVGYFREKGVPRAVSVLSVYVLVLGLGGLVLAMVVPAVLEQINLFSSSLPIYLGRIQESFGINLNGDFLQTIQNFFNSTSQAGVVSGTFGVFSGFFSFITVLVISFYLVAEERGMKKFVSALLPEHHHEFTLGLLEKVQKKMGLWVLGQLILSLSIFALTLVGLMLVGVIYGKGFDNPIVANALFLALLAGVLEIVPYIGPFVSAIPALIIAFVISPALALAVGILYLFIQKMEGYVLVPKVMERTVGTSPLAVLVALLVGFKLAGILGLLISIPLVSAATVVFNEFMAERK